jgi:hypothetical protein
MLMDTFLPAAVVLLTLGSIGLALVNLNAEKNVNKNYSEESIRGGKMYTFSCTWKQFFSGMETENAPLTDFLSILRDQAYSDYFLEMKPTVLDDSFKFVILDARGALESMKTSPNDFRQYCTGSSVSSFYNLGKDAILTIPCPKNSEQYGHLSQFSRSSTLDLQTLLWRRVFSIAKDAGKPMYISTDGRTVPWLHVRIEDNPKYYKYSL